jgi:hypothetical protein
MYDSVVDIPRLYAELPADGALAPTLEAARQVSVHVTSKIFHG